MKSKKELLKEKLENLNQRKEKFFLEINNLLKEFQDAGFIEPDFEKQYALWDAATLEKFDGFLNLEVVRPFPPPHKGCVDCKDFGEIDGFRVYKYRINFSYLEQISTIKFPLIRYNSLLSSNNIDRLKALIKSAIVFTRKKAKYIEYFPQLEKKVEALYVNFIVNKQLIQTEIDDILSLSKQKVEVYLKAMVCQNAFGILWGIIGFTIIAGLSISVLAGVAGLVSAAWIFLGSFVGFFVLTSLMTHAVYKINKNKRDKAIRILKTEMDILEKDYESEKAELIKKHDPFGFKQGLHQHIKDFLSQDTPAIQSQEISTNKEVSLPLPLFNFNSTKNPGQVENSTDSEQSEDEGNFFGRKFN